MSPTRARTLALIAVVAFGLGWLMVAAVEAMSQRLLQVPWTAAAALALMAFSLFVWALLARPRLLRKQGRPPMDPIVATRTAALALAASRTGAGVLGFYVGVAVGMIPAWDTPAGRDYCLAALAAALASAALVAVGLWLESMCRLRGGGDDKDDGAPIKGRPQTGQAANEAAR